MKLRKSLVLGFWLGIFWAWSKPIRQIAANSFENAFVNVFKKFVERVIYGETLEEKTNAEATQRFRYAYHKAKQPSSNHKESKWTKKH